MWDINSPTRDRTHTPRPMPCRGSTDSAPGPSGRSSFPCAASRSHMFWFLRGVLVSVGRVLRGGNRRHGGCSWLNPSLSFIRFCLLPRLSLCFRTSSPCGLFWGQNLRGQVPRQSLPCSSVFQPRLTVKSHPDVTGSAVGAGRHSSRSVYRVISAGPSLPVSLASWEDAKFPSRGLALH